MLQGRTEGCPKVGGTMEVFIVIILFVFLYFLIFNELDFLS